LAGDREMCEQHGMDGYVTKPLDPKLLFQEVVRVLSSKGKTAKIENPSQL